MKCIGVTLTVSALYFPFEKVLATFESIEGMTSNF